MTADVVDLYLRKSNKDKRRSVERQLHDLTETAAHEGLTIGRVFVDPDLSASRFARKGRPDFDELLKHIESGCHMIGIAEASRGSRRLTEWSAFLDLCREQRVKIWVSSHERVYDLSRRRDWRALADEGLDAADESEKLSERVLSGKRKAAREGKPAGRLQYGFTRTYNAKGEFVEQVAHPTEAPIVAEMVRRVAAGDSLFQVARDLNDRGVTMRGGSPWAGRFIRQVVLRPSYVGRRVHQGQDVGPAAWEPIVDVDEWRQAVALLTRPERRATTRGTALAHWLTNVALCGVCQRNRLTLKSGVAGKRRYHCDPREGCGKLFVSARALESIIERMVLARLGEDDAAEIFHRPIDSRALRQAESEQKTLDDRLKEHYAESAAGRLSARGLSEVEAQLLPDIDRARARVRRLSVPADLDDMDPAEVIQRWPDLPAQTRRRYVRVLAELVVAPAARRGPVFDVRRLDGSRWVGDTRTWGELRPPE